MGKIRIKTLGDEQAEKEQKKKARLAREAKQAQKKAITKDTEKSAEAEKESSATSVKSSVSSVVAEKPVTTENTEDKKRTRKKDSVSSVVARVAKKSRSKKYQSVAKTIEKNKVYSLSEALELLPKLKLSKFDETVELHVNTTEQGVSGKTKLPHGTGKEVKVAIADPSAGSGQVDALLKKIESGTIDFDVLIATPDMMPKLAKVARILGPKGLMPNPKNGTISANPEKEAEKFKGGNISFKTETKASAIHLTVGKLSFGDKKLAENIKAILSAIPSGKIKNTTLKSTMSPGIKIQI